MRAMISVASSRFFFFSPICFETVLRSLRSASTSWMISRRCASRARNRSRFNAWPRSPIFLDDEVDVLSKIFDIQHGPNRPPFPRGIFPITLTR